MPQQGGAVRHKSHSARLHPDEMSRSRMEPSGHRERGRTGESLLVGVFGDFFI